jgi:hypothetical protein
MKPEAQFGKIKQVYDGQTHRYYTRRDGTAVVFTVCCSCKLVHLEQYLPRKTYIRVRAWRDDKRTAILRKRKSQRR